MTAGNGDKLISVVIPLYNKRDTIKATIQSVLNQTFQDFEIVVVDDGSTDDSCELVRQIADKRVRIISQANRGVSAARNTGIRESRGGLIAFLDADDRWDTEYLAGQVALMEAFPECGVFASNYRFSDSDGKIFPTSINKLKLDEDRGVLTNYFEVASCSNCPIWTSAVMVRKEALLKIGCFPEGISSGEDLLTWARLACENRVAYNRKALATYVIPASLTDKSKVGRPHDKVDLVGKELKKLYHYNKSVRGLRSYLSFWHKMRASVSVRSNRPANAIYESLVALSYSPVNKMAIAIILLSLTPEILRKRLLKALA